MTDIGLPDPAEPEIDVIPAIDPVPAPLEIPAPAVEPAEKPAEPAPV